MSLRIMLRLQPIRPYLPPQWLVQPEGDTTAYSGPALHVHTLDDKIMGWGMYTHIVSIHNSHYLAVRF